MQMEFLERDVRRESPEHLATTGKCEGKRLGGDKERYV